MKVQLKLAIALALLLPGAMPLHAAGETLRQKRPNILLVLTDDQRYDTLSVVQAELGEKGRFPWTDTPNMDRLARDGVRFRNAFVVNSICSPSRASILTGTYGHRNGIINNRTNFPQESVTYPKLLRDAGYRTGYFGKWHMGFQAGQRPGFEYSASFIGQGHYFDEPFEVNGTMVPTSGWVDDVTTQYALEFLRAHKNETNRPFAMTVGFKSPHGPHTPPPRLAGYYAGRKSRPVPNLGIPPVFDSMKEKGKKPPLYENPDYHRCLKGVDENLGRILDEIDSLGFADNTLVVFTSDNGMFRGEHGLGDKRAAYEESMRVPMIFRYPALSQPPAAMDQIVLNIDIAPTILDFAGVPIPASMQGRSWKPLLAGSAKNWRTSFFYAYHLESEYPRIPTTMAVRTSSAKLIRYFGKPEWSELFDLKADPYELHNLIADPAAAGLKTQMEELYDRESAAVGFHIPENADQPKEPGKKKKVKQEKQKDASPE